MINATVLGRLFESLVANFYCFKLYNENIYLEVIPCKEQNKCRWGGTNVKMMKLGP